MRYTGFVISVKDINASKKFYEELFDLEVYQDYGINITFPPKDYIIRLGLLLWQ